MTARDDLREAVARAIWSVSFPPYPYECVSGDELLDIFEAADAALAAVRAALREPSAEMLRAVEKAQDEGYTDIDVLLARAIAASPLADPGARDDGKGVG